MSDLNESLSDYPILVSSAEEAIRNIHTFNEEIHQPQGEWFLSRLPFVRAWYAIPLDANDWRFGPSKFIGYANMNCRAYREVYFEHLDGRQTEKTLGRWFTQVEDTGDDDHTYDPDLYAMLHDRLSSFVGQFKKKPSKLARISVRKPPQYFF